MKKSKKTLLFLFVFLNLVVCMGQTSKLVIIPQIQLPYDSLTKLHLLNSLDIFLKDKTQDMDHSTVVDSKHYRQFKAFFDLFKNAEKSTKYKDSTFFKCHLTNVVLQPDQSYKISLSYYGISPDKAVIQKLGISMIARPEKEGFKFYSPFELYTKHWKSKTIGNIEFFYEKDFNSKIAHDFENYNTTLAQKLNVKPLQFQYYKCQDIQQVYHLLGIDYDLSINGEVRSGWFDEKNKRFIAGTNTDQYKHDLTHAYFGLTIADSLENWTAEEGYNIYTTDFWGESSKQVFQYLIDYAKTNPTVSLLEVFEKNIILKYPIPIKYPIAAVIMRKIEQEYGFEQVIQLIGCGKTDDKFFAKLKEISGIRKETFDQTVRAALNKYAQ
jgi:hypothetical protein